MNKFKKYLAYISIAVFVILSIVLSLAYFKTFDFDSKERVVENYANGSLEIDVKNLKIKINQIRKTKYSSIVQLHTNEYVRGHKGLYYVIDLKDTVNESVILFPAGEYAFKDNDWAVVYALDKIKTTVLDGIPNNINYLIFIEGQADKTGDKSFNRKFNPYHKYNKIEYYKTSKLLSGIYCYDSISSIREIKEPIRNCDLPLLRAKYIYEELSSFSDIPRPIILEGEVKEQTGKEYRNGKVIMFIDTTKYKKQ